MKITSVVCKACGKECAGTMKKCSNCGAKLSKPLYMKWWFWIVVSILIINIHNRLDGNDSSNIDISEFEWNNMVLSDIIPEPESNLGSHLMNSDDYLSVNVHEVSKETYKEYVNRCREKGFTVEISETDSYYSACNADDYELMLYYFDDEQYMSIDLDAPSESIEENIDTGNETTEDHCTDNESIEETTDTESEIVEDNGIDNDIDTKISFEIINGQSCEYAKTRTVNIGTEFEETFYEYHIPAGTYTVINKSKSACQVNIYSNEYTQVDGWDEPKEVFGTIVVFANDFATVTIEEGQHLNLSDGSETLFFEKQ